MATKWDLCIVYLCIAAFFYAVMCSLGKIEKKIDALNARMYPIEEMQLWESNPND